MSAAERVESLSTEAMPADEAGPRSPQIPQKPFWSDWWAVATLGHFWGVLKIVGFDSVNSYGRVVYGGGAIQRGLPIKVIPHQPAVTEGGPLRPLRADLFETAEEAIEFAVSRGFITKPKASA